MLGDPVHLTLGSCRYARFRVGNTVELSYWGWDAGLAVNYAYTIGRVIQFKNGILTILRDGMDRPQDFHPCFWQKISKRQADRLRKEEYKEYWLDHVPYASDDLYYDEV